MNGKINNKCGGSNYLEKLKKKKKEGNKETALLSGIANMSLTGNV